MVNGIEHNGVDQADVVIRKVTNRVVYGLLSMCHCLKG